MAWRRSGAPQVMAYWLTSASIARQAAALISAGAGKSGIPWARLTAPCLAASIDIPRITLSVNRDDFCESRGVASGRGLGAGRSGGPGRRVGPCSAIVAEVAPGRRNDQPARAIAPTSRRPATIGRPRPSPDANRRASGPARSPIEEVRSRRKARRVAPRRRSPSPDWPGRDSDPGGREGQGWRPDTRKAGGRAVGPSSRRSTAGSRPASCFAPAPIRTQTAAGGQAVGRSPTPRPAVLRLGHQRRDVRAFPAAGGRVNLVVDGSTSTPCSRSTRSSRTTRRPRAAHTFNNDRSDADRHARTSPRSP